MKRSRLNGGFTIIEVVVAMAILAVLATMLLPLAEMAVKRGKEKDLKMALWEIRAALDAYKKASDEGTILKVEGQSGFPATIDALVSGVQEKSKGTKIYFLRRLPADPFLEQSTEQRFEQGTSPKGWGLRSYASAPDRPQPGADVYDVYSLSKKIGSNGIPYSKW